MLAQVAVGRGDHADVDSLTALGAQRLELALLQHPQQLGLERRAHRGDLVEKDGSAVGERKLAFLVRRGAGEGAADVAEQLRLEKSFRDCRAVHLDERHAALGAAIVNRPRHELLAGAGFAQDQDRALRFGHELCTLDHLLNRSTPAHDAVVIELFIALAQEVAVLRAETLVVQRPADHHQQLVDHERRLQIVERAQLHRFDGAFHRRVCRHHENLRALGFRSRADVLADEIESARLRHHVVDDEDVEASFGQQALRLVRTGGVDDVLSVVTQRTAEGLEDFFFVVDEKDRAARGDHQPCRVVSAPASRPPGAAPKGKSIRTSVPRPGSLETEIVP